jgi:hypothetical protein
MTVKAYAYSRYSSAAQASGDSLRRQLKSAIEFAEAQGVELDTTLQDRGVSAFTGANRVKGALGSFIARVQAGEIDSGSFLVLDSMDRLSRESETEVLHLLTGLTRAGIKVVDQAENLILDDKADSMAFIRVIINASRSHLESKEKGRKVKAAHGERKARAREQGIGWHKTGPSWLKSEAHGSKGDRYVTYSPIPERVATVQRIFDMREAGLGCSVIAKMLNDEGVQPFRHASGWSTGVVYTMLGSRTVLGEYQPKNKTKNHRSQGLRPDGDPVAGLYGEPIIDLAQFHRVQAIMSKSAMAKGRKTNGQNVNNLFQGISICGACGGRVGYQRKGKSEFMLCNHAAHHTPHVMPIGDGKFGQCTNMTRYRYTPLEASILAHVAEFDLAQAKAHSTERDALDRAIGEREEIDIRVQRLLTAIEDGDETGMDRYRERRAELKAKDAEIAKLKAAVSQDKAALPPVEHQAKILALKCQLATLDGAELFDLRNRLAASLKSVIDYLSFDPDGEVYAIILSGFRAYRFKDGQCEVAQVAQINAVREAHTGGQQPRERLFDRLPVA